ncbi:MFS transporter [Nocardia transvalensis]|nr:MFS transporter [Nocardia transvalensis]
MTAAEDTAATVAEISARIERLPLSWWQRRVRLLVGAVTLFDGFDQLLIAYVLPVLRREWHLDASGATWAITSGSVGMLAGALLAGWLADRLGRVRAIALCVALYSVTSLLMPACTGLGAFLPLRFGQGVGIGGEVLVGAAYISEIIGARRRGRFVLAYELVFVVGLLAAALVSSWVVPAWGWRPLFALGGLPVLLAVVLWRWVPESPRWLAARGRTTEAAAIVGRIEAEVRRRHGQLPAVAMDLAVRPGNGRLSEVFTSRYARRTAVLMLTCFTAYLVNYGLTSWLPSIYTGLYHVGLATALRYSLLTMVTGFFGAALLAATVDRLGRKPCLTAGLLGAGVTLLVLAVVRPAQPGVLAAFVSVAALFVFATNLGLQLYVAELYPTRIRTWGSGINGVAIRLGVIVGPVLVGLVATGSSGFALAIGLLASAALVGGVVLGLFGEETANRPLERLSP